jgi:hypothetical protein
MAKSKINHEAPALIDEYISNTAEFAQPVLKKLRKIILKADPAIVEDWKWGPNYRKNGMICGYAAFKKHVNLVFFKGSLMSDPENILTGGTSNLNTRHVKISSAKDINEKLLSAYIKEAVLIDDSGAKVEKKEQVIPPDFLKLLNKHKDAKAKFDKLSYTHRKEYINWITEAKKEETCERRLNKAIEMIRENRKEP